MTTPDADTIEVEGLGEPDPTMAGELPPEPEGQGELEDQAPPDHGMVVESLTVGLMAPFAIIATRRGPHWRTDADEVRPIAEALALVLPASALANRLVAASPWATAGVQLYALVQVRLDADAALAAANGGTATDEPRTDQGTPGAADGQAGDRLRGRPGANGAGPGQRADSLAGLGLASPGIGERPPGPTE